MTIEQELSNSQEERKEAHQDLRTTLTQVAAKLGRMESDLRPDHLMENHPVGACLVGGTLGLLFGAISSGRVVGPSLVAALMSVALRRRAQHLENESDGRKDISKDA